MATAPPALSFSRPAFAKLSPHPFLLASLSQSDSTTPASRTNGRAPNQDRPFQIHTSSLAHAHGSALVRLGDTTVVCGVRGEILPVTSIPQYRPATLYDVEQLDAGGSVGLGRGELKDYDLLVPNIELATGCAPQFLPGVPPTTLAQKLSTRVYSLLHSCNVVDPKDLRIWYHPPQLATDEDDKMDEDDGQEDQAAKPELKAYWVLYIDLLFVSFDGNPFDAAWTAVIAALKDTKLPVVRWDPDRELAVCDSRTNVSALNIRGLPVSCTAAVFLEKEHAEGGEAHKNKYWMLLDPDRLEEELCQEVVTVVVDRSEGETRIRSIEKQGGIVIGRELIRGFVGIAEKRWEAVRCAMAKDIL
ncbi:ribosomal protein S5 domain 2-like protein [Rhypophila decipiens]|uniref:Ribosomal RNA-processing protein 43 n=1 Tax=Rhypophila decipiens TaxID=261697 RepID=A0AAN7BD93_9PEZI|nr:ribosomal protein S5 domain 2-like protein [Rhypophila decipiens]